MPFIQITYFYFCFCNKIISLTLSQSKMEKLMNTLPSTKPDHLYSSNPSQLSFRSTKNPKEQAKVRQLIMSMRKVHRLRCNFLYRDVQQIFTASQFLLNDFLLVSSAQQLWNLIVPKGEEELRQREQINIFLKILLVLINRKQTSGDLGNIPQFQQYRKIIEWFINQIVAYQKDLRNAIQSDLVYNLQKQQQSQKQSFSLYSQKVARQFESTQAKKKNNMYNKLRSASAMKNIQILSRIQQDMHKIKASKQLRDAKDKSLLMKLAPYKWQKKHVYQDRVLNNQLDQTVQQDGQRKKRLIEHIKAVEKKKLRREQQKHISTQQVRSGILRQNMHIHLANERSQFTNQIQKTMQNLRHSVDVVNNYRVSSLKKQLSALAQHEDTLKIKQILHDHHLKSQFTNDIEAIVRPQAYAHQLPSRYCTINTERAGDKLQKTIEYHQRRLQKRIKGITNQNMSKTINIKSGRKSLVDLYDDSLNLMQ